jgi:hypothetical protein
MAIHTTIVADSNQISERCALYMVGRVLLTSLSHASLSGKESNYHENCCLLLPEHFIVCGVLHRLSVFVPAVSVLLAMQINRGYLGNCCCLLSVDFRRRAFALWANMLDHVRVFSLSFLATFDSHGNPEKN